MESRRTITTRDLAGQGETHGLVCQYLMGMRQNWLPQSATTLTRETDGFKYEKRSGLPFFAMVRELTGDGRKLERVFEGTESSSLRLVCRLKILGECSLVIG